MAKEASEAAKWPVASQVTEKKDLSQQ